MEDFMLWVDKNYGVLGWFTMSLAFAVAVCALVTLMLVYPATAFLSFLPAGYMLVKYLMEN